MSQACRTSGRNNRTSQAGNAGLMLSMHLKTTGDKDTGKLELFHQSREALAKSVDVYGAAYSRWEKATGGTRFEPFDLPVTQRLIAGLGSKGVLESGIRLHYTYGTPLIPGSALKGLAAHYCDTVLGERKREFKSSGEFVGVDGKTVKRAGKFYAVVFGTNESSGAITFHDAWIAPASITAGEALLTDVMTTHHPKYYSGARGAVPDDREDPVPVHFLSTRGTFRFVLEAENEDPESLKWLNWTMGVLKQALASWGAGGKTSSGYGRFAV